MGICASLPVCAQEPQDQVAAEAEAEKADLAGVARGKKLILTDGNFQIVREYSREGDRVRFYSVERSAWEEIPAALIDWPATEKAEADFAAQQQVLSQKIKAAAVAALAADINIDKSVPVKPGLFLPDEKGLYAIDGDTISLMEQDKTSTHINKSRALGRMITGLPLITDKFHVQVEGKKAALRLHTVEPEFYFRPDDGREPRIVLVRAEVKGDKREIMATVTDIAGTQKNEADEVTLQVWDAARGVYRFTVGEELKPGEYALVESTREGVAGYVWAFGVDAPGKAR
jgi:hypothetical protein